MSRSVGRNVVTSAAVVRRRWRAAEAEAVLGELESSGLSVSGFAAREGLDAQRLYRWRAQLAATGAMGPRFVEVKTVAAAALEVVLRSGVVVRVPNGFCEDSVRRLVGLLDAQGTASC
jgi:transposase-like protein